MKQQIDFNSVVATAYSMQRAFMRETYCYVFPKWSQLPEGHKNLIISLGTKILDNDKQHWFDEWVTDAMCDGWAYGFGDVSEYPALCEWDELDVEWQCGLLMFRHNIKHLCKMFEVR